MGFAKILKLKNENRKKNGCSNEDKYLDPARVAVNPYPVQKRGENDSGMPNTEEEKLKKPQEDQLKKKIDEDKKEFDIEADDRKKDAQTKYKEQTNDQDREYELLIAKQQKDYEKKYKEYCSNLDQELQKKMKNTIGI